MGKTGRPKKTDSETLVRLTEDFFATEGHGDASCLKCTRLAAYAAECGVDAKDYDFRRDEAVQRKIEELKQASNGSTGGGASAYRTLDIEGLLLSCKDISVLRRKLYELDGYWRGVHSRAEADRQEAEKLHRNRTELTGEIRVLKEAVADAESESGKLTAENRALKKENAWLRKQIRTLVYPAVANELLSQADLPNEKSSALRPEAVKEMIEDRQPQPFEGRQGSFEEQQTRIERLEAQMKAQVQDGK